MKLRLALTRGDGLGEEACRRLALAATVPGSSMAYVTAINVAVPAIGADLDIDLGGQQWVILSYSLALASLYLVAEALGDRLGWRRMFMVGATAFAVASALGGLAPSAAVLIVARVLQEGAGALLTTGRARATALGREVLPGSAHGASTVRSPCPICFISTRASVLRDR